MGKFQAGILECIGMTILARRKFVAALCCTSIALSLVAMPYKIVVSGASLKLDLQSAEAAKGGNGNGGGNGGGNSGGGNGNGNGGGSSNSGGNANGNGNSGGRSSSGTTTGSGSRTDADDKDSSAMEVRHRDGMSEVISNGRYIMKDARGRTIVNRRATSADETRLESFTH